MALETVQDYLDRARGLLQDTIVPYRYSDTLLVTALDMAIGEARRIRPELFQSYYGASLPTYADGLTSVTVDIDEQYRTPFLFFMVGFAQLEDDENTTDARATIFLQKFVAQLRTVDA